VAFEHSPAGGTVTRWTDTLVVRVESGRAVVADVIHGGDWEFATKGSLTSVLRAELGAGH
jgi:hypothetical protein